MLKEKEVEVKTNYTGSKKTYEDVKKQIEKRYGPEIAEDYNPFFNCMSYNQWLRNGFRVNKRERGFKSTVIIEKKDKSGAVIAKYPKTVVLFYETQVSKVA